MNAILILNCGSSSVKFAVIAASDQTLLLSGLAERLGEAEASLSIKYKGQKNQLDIAYADHEKALTAIVEQLNHQQSQQIIAVGHRVVHGGEKFSASCLVTDEVLAEIDSCAKLAPLHNPSNIVGIRAAQKAFPQLPQAVVFDTAFHQTLPETAYLYALPYSYYRDYGVRRYGFHGTSYRYIYQAVCRSYPHYADKKLIVAHLGNGASLCAIKNGNSLATSMGLTPLDGLVQGTRSGHIDPAIIDFLAHSSDKSSSQITAELWQQSGLLGLSQVSNDCRILEAKALAGDSNCQRALAVFVARLQETIGAYATAMNGVDAIVFTGGIGENSDYIRKQTTAKLEYLGFTIDTSKNTATVRGKQGNIAAADSKPLWVIPTDEEAMIASDTLALISTTEETPA